MSEDEQEDRLKGEPEREGEAEFETEPAADTTPAAEEVPDAEQEQQSAPSPESGRGKQPGAALEGRLHDTIDSAAGPDMDDAWGGEPPADSSALHVEPCPMSIPDILYGVLFRPSRTFEELVANDQSPSGLAFGVFATVALLSAWVTLYSSVPYSESRYLSGFLGIPLLVFVLTVSVNAVAWFGWSATLHLVAEFLGGRGRGTTLFTLVGLSYLPRVLMAPMAVVANITGEAVQTPARLLLGIWVLYLDYAAVRASHGLRSGRALLTVILPVVAILALVLIGILVVILTIMPLFRDLPELPL